ncbi:MAG: hypothetical protein BWY13_00344 [Euryarchaeota archaeon ADurb.Bin190]|nr:MAG: hypothetical protein BWY13_00344 [Euryarchaeota archaeon ADurb.Bin190]
MCHEWSSCLLDGLAGPHAARILVYLNDMFIAGNADDLAHQAFLADQYQVVHGSLQASGLNQWSGDSLNFPYFHKSTPIALLIFSLISVLCSVPIEITVGLIDSDSCSWSLLGSLL